MRKKNKRKEPEFKKPFIVLTRRKIAGWVFVIFFLCAWMFVLGILVGRAHCTTKEGSTSVLNCFCSIIYVYEIHWKLWLWEERREGQLLGDEEMNCHLRPFLAADGDGIYEYLEEVSGYSA